MLRKFVVSSVIAVSALAVAPGASEARSCPGANTVPSALGAGAANHTTLCLLNAQRRAHGLNKLHANGRLHHAAAGYAQLMARRNFFSHVSPSGSTPLSRIKHARYLAGARSWTIGENLAWATGSLATPRATVRAWMNSPGHRANILNASFREIGIGVAKGAPVPVGAAARGATYATDFGRRG
jgi:uncharacterized protein YkwD